MCIWTELAETHNHSKWSGVGIGKYDTENMIKTDTFNMMRPACD